MTTPSSPDLDPETADHSKTIDARAFRCHPDLHGYFRDYLPGEGGRRDSEGRLPSHVLVRRIGWHARVRRFIYSALSDYELGDAVDMTGDCDCVDD